MIDSTSPTLQQLRRSERGFTLIELILVISIIALLATLIFPATTILVERAQNTKCMNNLRQIGVSAHLAANDNDNRYPKIEVDPENPIYQPEDGAKSMQEALGPYGVSDKVLQCPTDLKGANWFAKLKTSYMWLPYADDEPTNNIMIYSRRGAFSAKLSRVRMAHDYEPIHPPDRVGRPKRWNTLYADGHVEAGGATGWRGRWR